MNCPECGKPIETDQNFCRDCGRTLTTRPRIGRLQMAGIGVMALIFGGLITAMVGKMLEMRWLTFQA